MCAVVLYDILMSQVDFRPNLTTSYQNLSVGSRVIWILDVCVVVNDLRPLMEVQQVMMAVGQTAGASVIVQNAAVNIQSTNGKFYRNIHTPTYIYTFFVQFEFVFTTDRKQMICKKCLKL